MDLIQHHTDESLKEGSNLIGHRAVALELSQTWYDPYTGSRYENLVEPITEPLYNDWEQELHDALERDDTENDIIRTPR